MSNKRDYTSYSFYVAIIVVVIMLAINFIPRLNIGNTTLKRTNIISDIVKEKDSSALVGSEVYSDTSFLAESIASLAVENLNDTNKISTLKTHNWVIDSSSTSSAAPKVTVINIPEDMTTAEATKIEDFSEECNGLDKFYASLTDNQKGRPTRIAVMGDSFIEVDIISADIREQLQEIYSGRGVGFVPFASPLSKYRGTVSHTFSKWKTYNVMQKRSAPAHVKDMFFVSGITCLPDEGATTRMQGVTFRKHIKRYSTAKLLFINKKKSVVNVVVNDSVKRVFRPESSPYVQQININADIEAIDIKIDSVDGFVGYGIVMEDRSGVSVDNYSIRSNSGMALFGTDASINHQINNILGYDLIVLQYGLNAMSAKIMNYESYSGQLVKIINYIKKCFPGSAIIVMSVGDRSTQHEGQFVTMPAVHAMIAAQKAAAQKTGVAFWNTYQAMGGKNSMVGFVKRKWAAKDYTHIGYAGGQYIGSEFVKSLISGTVKGSMLIDSMLINELSDFNIPTHELDTPRVLRDSAIRVSRDSVTRISRDSVANPRKDSVIHVRQDSVARPRKDSVTNPRKDSVAPPQKDSVTNVRRDSVTNTSKESVTNVLKAGQAANEEL